MLLAIDDVEYLLSTPTILSLLVTFHEYQAGEQLFILTADGLHDLFLSPPVYVHCCIHLFTFYLIEYLSTR